MDRVKTTTRWQEAVDQAVDAQVDRMIALRRHMHMHPDLSGREQATAKHIAAQIESIGLPCRIVADGCGLLVDFAPHDNGEPSRNAPCIAMRGDIDALSIEDAKETEHRSRVPGVMHACGHDGHAATVFGAVAALHKAAASGALPIELRWRAIFQPAEESNAGAIQMIGAGALEGVDTIISLHMDPTRPVGAIGVRAGAFTADCDEMYIDVRGRGGHASRPHESVDPIAAAAQLINSIYLFVPRANDSHDPVVVTIGQIQGGDHYNVIPDRVTLKGTVRSIGEHVRIRTHDHIRQLARGLAEASETQIEVVFREGPPSVQNDAAMTNLIAQTAGDLLGEQQVQSIDRPSMGGEDFAHYLFHIPGAMFRLGCVANVHRAPPLHSAMFDLDERSLAVGAKILARTIVSWSLKKNQQS